MMRLRCCAMSCEGLDWKKVRASSDFALLCSASPHRPSSSPSSSGGGRLRAGPRMPPDSQAGPRGRRPRH
eukprot:6857195-Pyramimonas_sp.AAC.1